jgi:HAD superfamily hydrolase (TIGR01490 family)
MSERGRIAAFFDLDGTVVAPPSLEYRFAAYLTRRGELRSAAVFKWLRVFLEEGMKALFGGGGTSSRLEAVDENKNYLAGVREASAQQWAEEYIGSIECFSDAIGRVAWHRDQGHSIFFVSGTIAPLARAMAGRFARSAEIGVAATELESFAGLWTGCTAGAAVSGSAKARAVREFAARRDINLAQSYAYGDSFADRWMLAAVGNSTAVNPGAGLTLLARRRGWRIVSWPKAEHEPEMSSDSAKRTLAHGEKL